MSGIVQPTLFQQALGASFFNLPAPVRSGMGALKRALASHQGQWDRHRSQAVADLLLRAAADIAAVTDD